MTDRLGLNILANANLNTVHDVERLTPADLNIPTDSENTLNSTSTSSSSHISNHFTDPAATGKFFVLLLFIN